MKLKNNYPVADPHQLTFIHPHQTGIALELARRLAAYAQYVKKPIRITSGYRSIDEQKRIWIENGGTFKDGKYIWEVRDSKGAIKPRMVAVPGNSWHNGHCAVDIADDQFWQAYMIAGDMHKTVKKQELYKFGLCLPLNYVDAASVFEWWHIQPVETLGYTGDRTKYLDADDELFDPKKVYQWSFEEAVDIVADFTRDVDPIDPDIWKAQAAIHKYFPMLMVKIATAIKKKGAQS